MDNCSTQIIDLLSHNNLSHADNYMVQSTNDFELT